MLARLAVLTCLLAAQPAAAAPEGDGFRVVVHPTNKAAQGLKRAELSQLFLKKATRWPDGRRVLPVEPADAELRERFAKRVHGKSAMAVKSYWNQQIFAGREVPPPEKRSDAEVAAYVRENPEAIGYVASGADVAGLTVLSPKD